MSKEDFPKRTSPRQTLQEMIEGIVKPGLGFAHPGNLDEDQRVALTQEQAKKFSDDFLADGLTEDEVITLFEPLSVFQQHEEDTPSPPDPSQ